MTAIVDILTPDRSLANAQGGSKKKVFEQIAALAAVDLPDTEAQTIFDSLLAREKLGSTGFGNGVAIPHCRLTQCLSPLAVVLHLLQPVDYDAPDEQQVDLVFSLLVPQEADSAHLALLSQVASLFASTENCARMRTASDNEQLYRTILSSVTTGSI